MLGGLRISACAAIAAAPAVAQTGLEGHGMGGNATVADVWTEFETSCSAAVSDPLGFVTNHPLADANGAQLVARSPDNQVVVLYNLTPEGVFRQIEMTGIPGELQILCDVHGGEFTGESMGDFSAAVAAKEEELRAFLAARPDTVVVGGRVANFDGYPGMSALPDAGLLFTPIFGVQTEFGGARRYVYANVEGGAVGFLGLYVYGAEQAADAARAAAPEPPPAAEPSRAPEAGAAAAMGAVLDACLRNYRTPDAALPALEAAGMRLTPGMDAGSFEFSGSGVFGIVMPGPELFCSIQSQEVPLDTAQAIGGELAHALFPDMIQPGAPEGGKGPCDGLSIFAPRQLIWLRYAQAGNSGECINDGTSAIIMN